MSAWNVMVYSLGFGVIAVDGAVLVVIGVRRRSSAWIVPGAIWLIFGVVLIAYVRRWV